MKHCKICGGATTCPANEVRDFVEAKGVIAYPLWERGNHSDSEAFLYNRVLEALATAALFEGSTGADRVARHFQEDYNMDIRMSHTAQCEYCLYKIIPKKLVIIPAPKAFITIGELIGKGGSNVKKVKEDIKHDYGFDINIHIDI